MERFSLPNFVAISRETSQLEPDVFKKREADILCNVVLFWAIWRYFRDPFFTFAFEISQVCGSSPILPHPHTGHFSGTSQNDHGRKVKLRRNETSDDIRIRAVQRHQLLKGHRGKAMLYFVIMRLIFTITFDGT